MRGTRDSATQRSAIKLTRDKFWKTYGAKLNAQQRKAAETSEGPVLLLAVPGSGKTTTLVTRLGYLICVLGIAPEKILTLTYTVAAAGDMAERFGALFGQELGSRMQFRTINGVCASIIASFGKKIGRRAYTLVTDESQTAGLLRKIYQDVEEEYPSEGDLQGVRTLIAYIKNMMLPEDGIKALEEDCGISILEIYKRYCQAMRAEKRMDYDDQLIYARALLLRFPELLAQEQAKHPYLCVDEAQDTSRIQHEIIALLAGKSDNLFMVGDEDQSIYGFRAAYPQALLNFQEKHKNAQVLLMETNYRSNAKIVEAADGFIQKNILRHSKNMRAARPAGADIRFIALRARGAQYTYLAKVAASNPREKTAVLCRDNESLIPLVDILEAQGTPFTLKRTDTAFFTSRTVTDIRNILAFAQNPKDVTLFSQIYYKLNTYLSKNMAAGITRMARQQQLTPLQAAVKSGALPDTTLRSFRAVWNKLLQLPRCTAIEAMNLIMGSLGYGSYLERSGIRSSKIPILYSIAGRAGSASAFVQRLDDLERFLQERKNTRTNFILSTIHASKGLEYDTVYLIDAADGIYPQAVPEDLQRMDADERSTWEEERRLFYVGITRARDNLILFEFDRPATLIRELKEAAGVIPKQPPLPPPAAEVQKAPYAKVDDAGYQAYVDSLAVGLSVIHARYGPGVILRLEGKKVWVQFDDGIRPFSLPVVYRNGLLWAE